jgi:YidC/Oxa1 family membrane protein insertase
MEKRLLVAFLLMGAILFLTPYFYRTFVPQTPARPVTPVKTSQPAPVKPPEPAEVKAPSAAVPAAAVSAQKEELAIIETDVYRVTFSNRGATVRSWQLKKYKDNTGKPLELVSATGAAGTAYPFSLVFEKQAPADLNQALYSMRVSPGRDSIEFEYSDGAVSSRKSFRFQKSSYRSQFLSEVTEKGRRVAHLVSWRGGFGDSSVANASGSQRTVYYDAAAGDLVINDAGAAEDGPVTATGHFSFAGLEDLYFAAVFLPGNGAPLQIRTTSDKVAVAPDNKEEMRVGVAVGGEAGNQYGLFVGPKDLDLLESIDPRLGQLVDFGKWFGFLARPLFLALNWLNDNFVHNYGWSIVVVTIIINFALLPLKLTSMKSMKRMQSLQPQIQAINAKYKGIGLRDPRKAQQNQEVMELYKKHGINPMGGCLPMVLQIPFFIAFYNVLTIAIEMRGASWLWVSDLSQPETLPIRILPIAMIIAQFAQQKMTPSPSADPNQQRMMLMMPLVFGFMFYSVSSGLVLYWLTSNLVGIAQQWFINRSLPAAAPAQVPARQEAPAPVRRKRVSGGRR